jgi:hypothetical protein
MRTEILPHNPLKIGENFVIDSELAVEGAPHIPLHPLDSASAEHALGDAGPEFVGVWVVADYFRGDHESGNEKVVAGGEAGGGKAFL